MNKVIVNGEEIEIVPGTIHYPEGEGEQLTFPICPIALIVPPNPDKSLTNMQLWGEEMSDEVANMIKADAKRLVQNMESGFLVLMINRLVNEIHENARNKGFYDEPVIMPQSLALIHSEVSEALEAHRNAQPVEDIVEELADIVIRVLDLCGYQSYDIGTAILNKMEKNRARPRKHGKRY